MSALHRACASKATNQELQQKGFLLATQYAEEASVIYIEKRIENNTLKGKIFFNCGAAHADNPKGDLRRAADFYAIALKCYEKAGSSDDLMCLNIRLGKINLLQKNYAACQDVINSVRSRQLTERIALQVDYLEAQLHAAQDEFDKALKIAACGLNRAKTLGAKEDENRLQSLTIEIKKRQKQNKMTVIGHEFNKLQTSASAATKKIFALPLIATGTMLLVGYIGMRILNSASLSIKR